MGQTGSENWSELHQESIIQLLFKKAELLEKMTHCTPTETVDEIWPLSWQLASLKSLGHFGYTLSKTTSQHVMTPLSEAPRPQQAMKPNLRAFQREIRVQIT